MYKKKGLNKTPSSYITMHQESIFLEYLGDSPRMRILEFLIDGRDFDYSLTDLLEAKVSWGTINSLIPKLLNLQMIKKNRTVGRATLYQLDQNNKTIKKLIQIHDTLIQEKLNEIENKLKRKHTHYKK